MLLSIVLSISYLLFYLLFYLLIIYCFIHSLSIVLFQVRCQQWSHRSSIVHGSLRPWIATSYWFPIAGADSGEMLTAEALNSWCKITHLCPDMPSLRKEGMLTVHAFVKLEKSIHNLNSW